jgi:hypothetical protein
MRIPANKMWQILINTSDVVVCGLLNRLPGVDVGPVNVGTLAVPQCLEEKAILPRLLWEELLECQASSPIGIECLVHSQI